MLLRAHVAGALDLGKADVLDPRWWKKAEFIMQELERTDDIQLEEYEYRINLALIDQSSEEEVLKMALDATEATCHRMEALVRPWLVDTPTTDLHDTIKTMRDQYVEIFGDPSTPEFQARLADTIAYLKRDK